MRELTIRQPQAGCTRSQGCSGSQWLEGDPRSNSHPQNPNASQGPHETVRTIYCQGPPDSHISTEGAEVSRTGQQESAAAGNGGNDLLRELVYDARSRGGGGAVDARARQTSWASQVFLLAHASDPVTLGLASSRGGDDRVQRQELKQGKRNSDRQSQTEIGEARNAASLRDSGASVRVPAGSFQQI